MNGSVSDYWMSVFVSNRNSAENLRKVIKEGADLEVTDFDGNTILLYILKNFHIPNIEVIEVLLESNVNIHAKNSSGNTALHCAVLFHSTEHVIIQRLLKYGADPNTPNNEGNTALHCALLCHSTEHVIFERLLEYGADPNTQNNEGNTALHLALLCHLTEYEIIQRLLEHGANPNTPNKEGNTPFHFLMVSARTFNSLKTVKLFFRYKVNVNCINVEHETPLHVSLNDTSSGSLDSTDFNDVLKELLMHGADVNATNYRGLTALQLVSVYRDYPDIAKILVEYGARFKFNEIGRFYCYRQAQVYKDIDKLIIKYRNVEVQESIDFDRNENIFNVHVHPLTETENPNNSNYMKELEEYQEKCSIELQQIENEILPLRKFKTQMKDENCIDKLIEIHRVDKEKYPIYNDVLHHMVAVSRNVWIGKIKLLINLLRKPPLFVKGLQNMKRLSWMIFVENLSSLDLYSLVVGLAMLIKQQLAAF